MSNDGKGFENDNYFSDYRRTIENCMPMKLINISLNLLSSNLIVLTDYTQTLIAIFGRILLFSHYCNI